MAKVAPYGSWVSPLSAGRVAAGGVGLSQVLLDGDDIYWVEQRPAEGGRNVVVRRVPDGQVRDVTPPPFNARTRVHEYGGGAFLAAEGIVYFSNFADQAVYRQAPEGAPEPLGSRPGCRYADYAFDRLRRRLICVREDHRGGEPANTLVALDVDGSGEKVLASSYDFYAAPRLSPDGRCLAWIAWNHPRMPWDGCELWLGEVKGDGTIGNRKKIAGGEAESLFQPEWSPQGILHFVSDRTGWWNLYRWREGRIEALCPRQAEFGAPQWVFGLSTYGFASSRRIVCAYVERGISRLAVLDAETGEIEPLPLSYTDISFLRVGRGFAVFSASSPQEPPAIVRLDLATGKTAALRCAQEWSLEEKYVSLPEAIEFPTEGGLTAHAFYYAPRNPRFRAPAQEKPPLIVVSHGGPTSAASPALNLRTQYWTSRGYGLLDVNYGGSTGYGRAYRERLYGQWGVVDVDDCTNGARHLVEQGLADRDRLIIRGASAGGFTVLCALTFRDIFKAGASYYGVADLEALEQDTHKFESHYTETLVGPYPQSRDLYAARSPIHFVDRLACPLILFQGLEDKIVPPGQAEKMRAALSAAGLPVAYVAFEGEQHGFRRAENIQRALEAELYFYSRVFGIPLAEPVAPVEIENL